MARTFTALALLTATTLLPACSTYTGDLLPHAAGGLPANAPERPAVPPPYPAVHDMPPARANAVLTDEEQRKAEEELAAARERQPGRTKAKAIPAKLEKERPGASRSP